MVLKRTVLGGIQAPSSQVTIVGRVINANTGLYTVPANRVAKIIGATMILDAVGVDATYAVAVLRAGTFRPVAQFIAVGGESLLSGELLLQAGDIVTNVGDAGSTNGTCDQTVTLQEYVV